MLAKLTKRQVDAALPKVERTYLVRDTTLTGFVLVVTPAGTKSYAVDYRAGRSRSAPKRRLTIGKHGSPWTPEQARIEARRLLGQIAAGNDPLAARHDGRKAPTVSALIDLYLAEGVAHKKPHTLASDRGRFEHWIRPRLGNRRVADITRADVERLMAAVITGRTVKPVQGKRGPGGVPRGGKGVATQVVILLGALLSFAVERGLRSDNPAHGIKKPPTRRMERFLSEVEIGRLGESLAAESNPYPVTAIKLLMLTGCRRGEIMNLQWEPAKPRRGWRRSNGSGCRPGCSKRRQPSGPKVRSRLPGHPRRWRAGSTPILTGSRRYRRRIRRCRPRRGPWLPGRTAPTAIRIWSASWAISRSRPSFCSAPWIASYRRIWATSTRS
jgi:integrase